MAIKNLLNRKEALKLKLQSLYDIEKALEKALPKMKKAAFGDELKNAFRMHLDDTRIHSQRLKECFEILHQTPKKLKGEGIAGIIEDGKWVATNINASPELKDSMLASAGRCAEHYKIATYMTAIDQANNLDLSDVVTKLEENLREEVHAEEKLSMLAEQNFI